MPVAPVPAEAAPRTGDGTAGAAHCPQCTTSRVPGKRFCRQCGFDFTAIDAGPSAAALQERAPINNEAPESEQTAVESTQQTQDAAAMAYAADDGSVIEVSAGQPELDTSETTLDGDPAADTSASTPAPVISRAIEATGGCPQCATVRTTGKRFCRTCGFDYTATQHADQIAQETAIGEAVAVPPKADEKFPAIAETRPDASATQPVPPVEKNTVASPTATNTTGSTAATGETQTGPSGEPGATPTSAQEEASARNAGRSSGADEHQTGTIAAPAPEQKTSGKKAWLIGGAAVVVGLAVGAGLLLRSHHSQTATDDTTTASAPTVASAPPASAPASNDLPTAPASASSSASLAAPSDAAAAAPQTSSTGETSAAPSAATSAPAVQGAPQPDTTAGAQAPVQTQPATQAPTVATAPAPEPAPQATTQPPAQEAAAQPAVAAQRAHEKPKKSVSPAEANGGANATIRAAIAGSLADGNSCFSNKKFDCAISNAEAVLRLDPHNEQALSMRKRAKAAQQNALNSMSIE
jgi:hypothetical protein